MSKRVVVSCFGDRQSADTIEELAKSAEVIAVAFDLGGPTALGAMRDLALAAGAVRCHALDVREEFAREVLLPALRQRAVNDADLGSDSLATAFVAEKLALIGELEHAAVVPPEAAAVPSRLSSRSSSRMVPEPVQLHIGFDGDVPVSINGVEMSLSELMESLETITGESALAVLDREMTRFFEPQTA
jgi:argininosuccinate synthase